MLLYVDGVMDGWEVSHVDIPSKHRERVCGFVQGVVKIPGGGVNSTMLSKNIIPVTTPKELRKL